MPPQREPPRILIVGAGVAGLTAAQSLHNSGFTVSVVDKGRAPGGRISSRNGDIGPFDHGAQYFTARDPRFIARVQAWKAAGVVKAWQGRIGVALRGDLTAKKEEQPARFVGVPSMRAIALHQARMLDVRNGVRISKLMRKDDRWHAEVSKGEAPAPADAVIITAPSEQATELLAPAPALAAAAGRVHHAPCWAVMVAFDTAIDVPFDGLFVHESPLSWVARDTAKPGRPAGERWVLHGGPAWSEAHLEDDADDVAKGLLDAFFAAVGVKPVAPTYLKGHRWRYAIAEPPIDRGHLFDTDLKIGAAGDWLHGARVEGAYLSGISVASQVREAFG
ncbi:MAG: FAD-dependent oxidoreductase [Myxococcota bacterium]